MKEIKRRVDVLIPLKRGECRINQLKKKYTSPLPTHTHQRNLVEIVENLDASLLPESKGETVVIGISLDNLGFREDPTLPGILKKVREVRGKFPRVSYATLGICTPEEVLLLGTCDPSQFPEDQWLFIAMDPVFRRNGNQKKFRYIFKLRRQGDVLYTNLVILKYEVSRDVHLPLSTVFLFPIREIKKTKKNKFGIEDRLERDY